MEEFRRLQEGITLDNTIYNHDEHKQYKIILKHSKGNEVIQVKDLKGSAITGQILWAAIRDGAPGSIQVLGIRDMGIKLSAGVMSCVVYQGRESDNVILRNLSEGRLLVTDPHRTREICSGDSIKMASGCCKLACGNELVELMLQRPQGECDGEEEYGSEPC
jgi:hypothetical protein